VTEIEGVKDRKNGRALDWQYQYVRLVYRLRRRNADPPIIYKQDKIRNAAQTTVAQRCGNVATIDVNDVNENHNIDPRACVCMRAECTRMSRLGQQPNGVFTR